MKQPEAPLPRFDNRSAFHAWVEQQPHKRWERQDGAVIAMAPERVVHARVKSRAWKALDDAVRKAKLPCEAFIDSVTVEVSPSTDFEPDVVVACSDSIGDEQTAVPNPVVVVEVLSPSTSHRDTGVKLEGYFSLPSIQHYLLVSTDIRLVVHHRRLEPGKLLTQLHREGPIDLDPPGLRVVVQDFYEGTKLA